MKKSLVLVVAAMILAGCSVRADPVELSRACVVENDGKNVQLTGILSARTNVSCSNRGGRMECGFEVLESAGGVRKMSADIEVGSGANTMDELQKSYKLEDLKIRDNHGSHVVTETEPVRLTGRLSVSPDAKACFMQVYKIEK